jgi:hypothetical protein
MFQIVENLQAVTVVQNDDEHAIVANRHNASGDGNLLVGFFASGQ